MPSGIDTSRSAFSKEADAETSHQTENIVVLVAMPSARHMTATVVKISPASSVGRRNEFGRHRVDHRLSFLSLFRARE